MGNFVAYPSTSYPRDALQPVDQLTPDKIYQLQRAISLLERVMQRQRDGLALNHGVLMLKPDLIQVRLLRNDSIPTIN